MLRFCDSFDHYTTSTLALKWNTTGVTAPSIVTSPPVGRTKNALQINLLLLSAVQLWKTFDNQATWIIGAAINFSTSAANTGYFSLYDGASRQISLAINTSGQLYIDKNGTAITTSTNAWVNGWHYVELKAHFNGASGTITVRVDGATWISYTGNISQSGVDQASVVYIGDYLGSNHGNPNLYVDDLVICDGQGSNNNDLLGDVTVDALFPFANGNYSAFTPNGSVSNYLCVNEDPPDGDTTYVSDNVLNDRDSYTFTATNNVILAVKAIQVNMDMRKQGGSARSVGAFTRQSGTNYDQTGISIGTTYSIYATIIELNPATSAAFTATEIANLEAGPKITL